MPFALLIIGVVLTVSGVKGTTGQLGKLLRGDFEGPNNFTFWFVSILIIGAIGYVKELKPLSNAFLWLVIVVLFIKNRSVFGEFNLQAFGQGLGAIGGGGAGVSSGTDQGNTTGAPFSIPTIHP